MNLWYVGVGIYIAGAVAMALGINLQKLSMTKEKTKLEMHRRKKWKQPLWVLGATLYTSSGMMLSAALKFAAQALLSPLMSVVLISNALLGHFLLKEHFGRRDFVATCVILFAVTITTVFAPHTEKTYTASKLEHFYGQAPFIVYALVVGVSLIALYLLHRRLVYQLPGTTSPLRKSDLSIGLLPESGEKDTRSSLDYAVDVFDGSRRLSDCALEPHPHVPLERVSRLLPFSYGAIAGIFGGFCSCMMKSAISVIVQEIEKRGFVGMLGVWLIYILLVLLAGSWVGQLTWINKGVEYFPAVLIVAVEAVINEITGVIGGLLYFQEYKYMSSLDLGLFCVGVIMGAVGVAIQSTGHRQPEGASQQRDLTTEISMSSQTKQTLKHQGL